MRPGHHSKDLVFDSVYPKNDLGNNVEHILNKGRCFFSTFSKYIWVFVRSPPVRAIQTLENHEKI